jgi:hypothetical protein
MTMIQGQPLYNDTVTIASGTGTIPTPSPARSLSPNTGVAIIITSAGAAGELVYDPADTVGHTYEAVADDVEDFVVGAWRWGEDGADLPLTLKSGTDGAVGVMIVEVIR